MKLLWLRTPQFRNLAPQRVNWEPGINLVLGPNGSGKSNLLEAIGVLGNARSFRSARSGSLVCFGCEEFLLEGAVDSNGHQTRLEYVCHRRTENSRQIKISGKSADVGDYLRVFPVTILSRVDRELVIGAPDSRRALLDRLAFLENPSHLISLRTYRRVLRHRNAALRSASSSTEMKTWEEALSRAAAEIIRSRESASRRLVQIIAENFAHLISESFSESSIGYRTEPWLSVGRSLEELEIQYQKRYNEHRARDRDVGFTIDGPHRHDLALRVEGRAPRDVLSSGQAKILGAVLRLAAHLAVEEERGDDLPLLVDDVDAELDSTVLKRFLTTIGESRQLILSSARDDSMKRQFPDAGMFWVDAGVVHNTERHGAKE